MAQRRTGWEALGAVRERLAARRAEASAAARPLAPSGAAGAPPPAPVRAADPEAVPEFERTLFAQAMAGVEPLKRMSRHHRAPPPPAPLARQRALDEVRVLEESLSDEFDPLSLLETDERLSWRRMGIGPEIVKKLRRGEWIIQDELDLHGARRDEARVLVADFVREATRRGLRCVRIVHGKGLGSVGRQPVLKSKVRVWLAQKNEVLAFCQARPEDGGSGALVVLLRPSD